MTAQARSPFRLLLKLFQDRFLENDSVGGGFQTNIYQMVGILVTISLLLVSPTLLALMPRPEVRQAVWELRGLRLFLSTYSFGVAAFAAVFQWDMLFPDRRDFLILVPFPIRLRAIVATKFLALMVFLLMLAAAMNLFPDIAALLMAMSLGSSGLRIGAAQIAATGGASIFAFLAVTAFQGMLISVTPAKTFRRISPWIQMLGMSLTVMLVLGFPVYAGLFPLAIAQRQLWPYLFPPLWFSGLYELCLGGHDQLLLSLAMFGIKMTALAVAVILLTWGLGFRRHFRRTLESEDAQHRPRTWSIPSWLVRNPQEWAIFDFIGKTLARSQKHQFFLATYLSAGAALAAFFGIAVRDGKVGLSTGGGRAVAFVIGFFFISGLRAVFQFPAELSANWLFRMTEARWTEVSRSATRKVVLGLGVVPSILLALPLESVAWSWPVVLEHAALQTVAAAMLVEAMFWNFDKVPFTCSYFAGRTSLALLVVLYVYGITEYSFNMADVESAVERRWAIALLFFAASVAALVVSWRRRREATAVRFDGSEPVIQTLELT
jgi:hypothetical protein